MIKLNKQEAAALTNLVRGDAWDVLQRVFEGRVREIQGEEVNGIDAFQTLRMLHKNQGKVEGLVEFFNELEQGNYGQ